VDGRDLSGLRRVPDAKASPALRASATGRVVGAWWELGTSRCLCSDFAVLWQGGKRITLPSLRVGRFRIGHANGINERGQIVGLSDTTSHYYHAVLWTLKR